MQTGQQARLTDVRPPQDSHAADIAGDLLDGGHLPGVQDIEIRRSHDPAGDEVSDLVARSADDGSTWCFRLEDRENPRRLENRLCREHSLWRRGRQTGARLLLETTTKVHALLVAHDEGDITFECDLAAPERGLSGAVEGVLRLHAFRRNCRPGVVRLTVRHGHDLATAVPDIIERHGLARAKAEDLRKVGATTVFDGIAGHIAAVCGLGLGDIAAALDRQREVGFCLPASNRTGYFMWIDFRIAVFMHEAAGWSLESNVLKRVKPKQRFPQSGLIHLCDEPLSRLLKAPFPVPADAVVHYAEYLESGDLRVELEMPEVLLDAHHEVIPL